MNIRETKILFVGGTTGIHVVGKDDLVTSLYKSNHHTVATAASTCVAN